MREFVPERGDDALAFAAPLVVHPVGQPPRGLRVAHHDRRRGLAQRKPVMDQGAAIEEQGVIRPGRRGWRTGRAGPSRPRRTRSPIACSDLASSMRSRSPDVAVRSRGSTGPARDRAGSGTRRQAAWRLAELERPAPRGTSPAIDRLEAATRAARTTRSGPSRRRGRSGSTSRTRSARWRRARTYRAGRS